MKHKYEIGDHVFVIGRNRGHGIIRWIGSFEEDKVHYEDRKEQEAKEIKEQEHKEIDHQQQSEKIEENKEENKDEDEKQQQLQQHKKKNTYES